mmetsp:Transcript_29767/g.34272  ORF Transcript_29767/g.34272 Transcript_29767/m.34272 type:complete len:92 (+) Transcript_29767:1269-1544(+)
MARFTSNLTTLQSRAQRNTQLIKKEEFYTENDHVTVYWLPTKSRSYQIPKAHAHYWRELFQMSHSSVLIWIHAEWFSGFIWTNEISDECIL